MLDVALFVIELALGIVVPYSALRFDLARLSPERLDRAWPSSSMWSALVAFGPLCLPFHFVKTRRSLWGLVLGLLVTIATLAVIAGISQLVEAGFGLEK
jgi:protein-S-isoprenylcysteine O-methyltransferase Ste14